MTNKKIDALVKGMIQSKKLAGQEDEYKRWCDRINLYNEWIEKHKLVEIKAGDKVDVRDTEYIWCVGIVEYKITMMDKPPLLYIHYEVRYVHSSFRDGIGSMMNI